MANKVQYYNTDIDIRRPRGHSTSHISETSDTVSQGSRGGPPGGTGFNLGAVIGGNSFSYGQQGGPPIQQPSPAMYGIAAPPPMQQQMSQPLLPSQQTPPGMASVNPMIPIQQPMGYAPGFGQPPYNMNNMGPGPQPPMNMMAMGQGVGMPPAGAGFIPPSPMAMPPPHMAIQKRATAPMMIHDTNANNNHFTSSGRQTPPIPALPPSKTKLNPSAASDINHLRANYRKRNHNSAGSNVQPRPISQRSAPIDYASDSDVFSSQRDSRSPSPSPTPDAEDDMRSNQSGKSKKSRHNKSKQNSNRHLGSPTAEDEAGFGAGRNAGHKAKKKSFHKHSHSLFRFGSRNQWSNDNLNDELTDMTDYLETMQQYNELQEKYDRKGFLSTKEQQEYISLKLSIDQTAESLNLRAKQGKKRHTKTDFANEFKLIDRLRAESEASKASGNSNRTNNNNNNNNNMMGQLGVGNMVIRSELNDDSTDEEETADKQVSNANGSKEVSESEKEKSDEAARLVAKYATTGSTPVSPRNVRDPISPHGSNTPSRETSLKTPDTGINVAAGPTDTPNTTTSTTAIASPGIQEFEAGGRQATAPNANNDGDGNDDGDGDGNGDDTGNGIGDNKNDNDVGGDGQAQAPVAAS